MVRIDEIILKFVLWATIRPRRFIWRWWYYSFKEIPVDPYQANASLLAMCGYKLEPSKPMKITSYRPGMRWFRFGFYVYATPIHHKSRHWQMFWMRWIDDPVELYLVRCALRPHTTPEPAYTEPVFVESVPAFQFVPEPPTFALGRSIFDSDSIEEWLK